MLLTLLVGFLGGGILSEVAQGYLPVSPLPPSMYRTARSTPSLITDSGKHSNGPISSPTCSAQRPPTSPPTPSSVIPVVAPNYPGSTSPSHPTTPPPPPAASQGFEARVWIPRWARGITTIMLVFPQVARGRAGNHTMRPRCLILGTTRTRTSPVPSQGGYRKHLTIERDQNRCKTRKNPCGCILVHIPRASLDRQFRS